MTTEPTASAAGGAPAPTNEERLEAIPVQTNQPEPLVVATEEPVAEQAEPVTTEPAAETATAPADGAQKTVPKLPDWAQKKIADAAFEAREAKRQAKEAQDELARLKAPKPATPTAEDTAAAQANAPAGGFKTQAEFDAAVAAEAQRRDDAARQAAAQQDFDTKSNTAYEAGVGKFGDDFKTAVSNLQQVGVMEPEFVSFVLETDDPAKVLFELGSDPDRATKILAMTPAKRAIELAKLSVTETPKPQPTKLSSAPRPVETVEGSARVTAEPRDDDDDATWFAKRNAEVRQRIGA